MKKLTLLLTLLLCAGALNGMEVPERDRYLSTEALSSEVKDMIFTALMSYDDQLSPRDNLMDTISVIKAMSKTNHELHAIMNDTNDVKNRKGFSALAHILADAFNTSAKRVTDKFSVPASKEYVILGSKLLEAIRLYDTNRVAMLIKQGADVNFNTGGSFPFTPLLSAVMSGKSELVKIVLNASAKPNLNHPNPKQGTILEFAQRTGASEEIKRLLKNAMGKEKK